MALKECDDLQLQRDQALTACCMAAAAEADLQLQPARRAAMLMDCLAVLRAAHPAIDAAQWGMGEFRRALRGPLDPLLPATSAPADGLGAVRLFDEDGLVRDALQDLCREHLVPQAALERHWPWARVRAEQEERRLYEALRRLEPQEYRRARALLAESPAGPVRVLRRAWDQLWMRFDFFEAVSDWPWCHLDGWWYPCPRCRWPMRVVRRVGEVEVRCEAHRAGGVHYRLGLELATAGAAPHLVGTGKEASAVIGLPASTEHLALSRPVWRYGVLPTLLEIELRDELQKLDHVQVQMWPGELRPDEYDLGITVAPPGRRTRHLRVDAKAWESVEALARALLEREPKPYALTIVLPDHQDSEVEFLKARLVGRRITVTTLSRLVTRIKQACGVGR